MSQQSELQLKPVGEHGKDIFLCHTGANKPWVERLAERIEAEPYQNRFLRVVFDKWDFEKGGNIVVDIEREIDACRFVGVVVTRALLGAEWPTIERSIADWSDPATSLSPEFRSRMRERWPPRLGSDYLMNGSGNTPLSQSTAVRFGVFDLNA